ncbi:MAG: DUF1931 domain-containing protein [Nanoarchaeota archaeon]
MGLAVKTNVTALVKKASSEKGSQVKNVAADFLPALEAKVKKLVEDAIERAKANNRRTVMGRDL